MPACAHHITGYGLGGTGTKADDYLVFALSNNYHSAISSDGIHKDVKKWESRWQLQAYYIIDNLNNAFNLGVIDYETWEKYTGICERIIEIKED